MIVKVVHKYEIGEYIIQYGNYYMGIATELLEFCSCCNQRINPPLRKGDFVKIPKQIEEYIYRRFNKEMV